MVTNMNYFLALVKKVLGIMLLHKLSIVAQTGYKACFFFFLWYGMSEGDNVRFSRSGSHYDFF